MSDFVDYNKYRNGNIEESANLLLKIEKLKKNILDSEHLNLNDRNLKNLSSKIYNEVNETIKYRYFDSKSLSRITKKIVMDYLKNAKYYNDLDYTLSILSKHIVYFKDVFNYIVNNKGPREYSKDKGVEIANSNQRFQRVRKKLLSLVLDKNF
jgi:hypothetical protein